MAITLYIVTAVGSTLTLNAKFNGLSMPYISILELC